MLFNEPKLLKFAQPRRHQPRPPEVSVLFNEPKLLKCVPTVGLRQTGESFSALQRAEIAEMIDTLALALEQRSFSALQRAEIAEILYLLWLLAAPRVFQCSSTSRNC